MRLQADAYVNDVAWLGVAHKWFELGFSLRIYIHLVAVPCEGTPFLDAHGHASVRVFEIKLFKKIL